MALRVLAALAACVALAFAAPAKRFDLVVAASELDLETAVAAGHRVHGVSDRLVYLTVPAGAAVAKDFEELTRVPYVGRAFYFTVELEAAVADARAYWADKAATAPGHLELLHALADRALFRARGASALPAGVHDAFPRTATFHTLAPHPFRPASRTRAFPKGVVRRDNVADLIAQVSADEIEKFATYLSGEAAGSPFSTRQAQSTVSVAASAWVEDQWQALGYQTSRPSFAAQYCPNVIAELPGAIEPDRYIVVGAHLDDRAQIISDTQVRAPGANDDGSGSALVMEIARILKTTNSSFRYSILIQTYCAEEQGLIGSRALASDYADARLDIIAMLQADMVGYQRGAEPELSFVNRYVDLDLMAYVQNVTATYLPDLATSETTACCSDHQSFLENGYASAGFVEAGGYTIDPQYHNTNDLVYRTGYSFEQIKLITQAVLASLAVLAELQ